MSEAFSIRLTPALREQLEDLADRTNRPASEIVREALRRYLAAEEFRAIRARCLPHAEAQGVLTDDDVFRLVS